MTEEIGIHPIVPRARHCGESCSVLLIPVTFRTDGRICRVDVWLAHCKNTPEYRQSLKADSPRSLVRLQSVSLASLACTHPC